MTGTYLSFFLTTFVGLTNVQLGTMNTVKGSSDFGVPL